MYSIRPVDDALSDKWLSVESERSHRSSPRWRGGYNNRKVFIPLEMLMPKIMSGIIKWHCFSGFMVESMSTSELVIIATLAA